MHSKLYGVEIVVLKMWLIPAFFVTNNGGFSFQFHAPLKEDVSSMKHDEIKLLLSTARQDA